MITKGANPFTLSACSSHLGSAASHLRDAYDLMRALGADVATLGKMTDAIQLAGNLAVQMDTDAEVELNRVNHEPVCARCNGMGIDMSKTLDPMSAIRCPTCGGI